MVRSITRVMLSVVRFAVVIATACALAPQGLAAPASNTSTVTGLYGAANPQWDGAFRQSLGLLGLMSAGASPSRAAVTWLLDQQCDDGSYQAYRADLGQPCDTPDPATGAGPQVDSTALAAMALLRVGSTDSSAAATRAMNWLQGQQRPDGGWPYIATGTSNANSTGLALAAWRTVESTRPEAAVRSVARKAIAQGTRFLGTLAQPCSAAEGARLAYAAGAAPDWSATAQGALGMTTALPVRPPKTPAGTAPCAGSTAQRVSSALARGLRASPLLPSSFGPGPDRTATSFAVLALVAAGTGGEGTSSARRALVSSARQYAIGDSGADPAAIGLLLLVADATGTSPTDFGGLNLIRLLQRSERT